MRILLQGKQTALLGCLDVHAVKAMPGEVLIGTNATSTCFSHCKLILLILAYTKFCIYILDRTGTSTLKKAFYENQIQAALTKASNIILLRLM